LKKRLYEKNNIKKEIFILIISLGAIYTAFSFDVFFCDIFCLTPGLTISLIYLFSQKIYLSYILSTVYSIQWYLGFNENKHLSAFIFIFLILISFIAKKKNSVIKNIFFVFYVIEFLFCAMLFNHLNLISTQLIQLFLFLIVFLHIRKKSFF
jgi:hypothetical protein